MRHKQPHTDAQCILDIQQLSKNVTSMLGGFYVALLGAPAVESETCDVNIELLKTIGG